MIYTNENYIPPVTYCEPNKAEVQRMNRQEAVKILREWRGRMDNHGVPDFGEKYKALGMAIEALSKSNVHNLHSGDLIIKGAKGIQDGLYNIQNGELFRYKAKGGTVRTYPIVEAQQDDWISVSERLPEDGIAVLTTTENGEVYIDQVITDPYKERYFQSNTGYDNYQVIAWKPLPKPYKESEE